MGKTENDWWWDQNPNLTLKERFRRRILLGQHCKQLGFNLNDKKELSVMAHLWNNYRSNQKLSQDIKIIKKTDDLTGQYYS